MLRYDDFPRQQVIQRLVQPQVGLAVRRIGTVARKAVITEQVDECRGESRSPMTPFVPSTSMDSLLGWAQTIQRL